MINLELEPYATQLRWELTQAGGKTEWGRLIGEFVEVLAKRCDEAGRCVIGHIKGFAALPDGGYLRVSAVSARMPADVSVRSDATCAQLTLTLNVLVYGYSSDLLQQLTEQSAVEVAAQFSGRVALVPSEHSEEHKHPI